MAIWPRPPHIILDGDTLLCSACKEPLRNANVVEQFKRHIAEKHSNPPEADS